MASPIEAQLILADAAQAIGGKVSMLGAGWSMTGVPTAAQAVVGLVKVPWDRANEQLSMHIRLINEDGQNVVLSGPDGQLSQKIEFQAVLEVGRPPGLKHGTTIDASFAINVPSMPLQPGRYSWQLQISDDVFNASFQVANQTAVIPPL